MNKERLQLLVHITALVGFLVTTANFSINLDRYYRDIHRPTQPPVAETRKTSDKSAQ